MEWLGVYGWYLRITHGTYGLTAGGRQALVSFADAVAALSVAPRGERAAA